jgi:F0F1-type ATP synthase alpha subunit
VIPVVGASGDVCREKEASMEQDRLSRVTALVILFLLATTLFNTLRANRVEKRTTSFRRQASYELKVTKEQLEEQKEINARLEQKLNLLLEAQTSDSAGN